MKEMLQIRDLVKKYDLFLFSDEVYREFCYTGRPTYRPSTCREWSRTWC